MTVDAGPRTVAAAIGLAAERLAAARISAPRREALRLWSGSAGPAAELELLRDPALPLDGARAAEFALAVERRAGGEPLAYVSGRAGFRHLELRCDRRALIPRPETEGLVDLVLARAAGGRLADIGTGSGCIALSLATEGSFDQLVAVDCSEPALALARENVRLSGAAVQLVASDFATALADASCDALVSNPPYLSEAELAALDPAVRDWEPTLALVSGSDGFRATDALLADGLRVIRPGGWIALELDCSRAAESARRAARLGWTGVAIFHDLFGRERYLLAQRSEA